jgi:hypothetical protein
MLDLRKLVGTAHAPTEITVDGVKFVGNNSASGFRATEITFAPDALRKLIEARVRELGVNSEYAINIVFVTKNVDFGEGADFEGATVFVKHMSVDGR